MSADPALVWVTDADNTLWDPDSVYSRAQLQLADSISNALGAPLTHPDPLAWLRSIDQDIAKDHPHGLRYPPSLLISAVAALLAGRSINRPGRSSVDSILPSDVGRRIQEAYLDDLKATPMLRLGVQEGFGFLGEMGARVIVLTEGSRDRISRTLDHFGLAGRVRTVLEAKKTSALFARIRASNPGGPAWAIGDQLDRDVLPAINAGFAGIFLEGGFRPHWRPASSKDAGYLICGDYEQAVDAASRAKP